MLWKGFYHNFSTFKKGISFRGQPPRPPARGSAPWTPRFLCPSNDLPWHRPCNKVCENKKAQNATYIGQSLYLHIQIPPDRLCGAHITQYHCGYCKLNYRWEYFEGRLRLQHARYSCHSSCSIPSRSTVLQLAVASAVLHYMRPTYNQSEEFRCVSVK